MVASGVRLNPGYGGTEFGSPTYALPRKGDEDDWAYMEFSERSKVRWVSQGDGTYECQFLVHETLVRSIGILTCHIDHGNPSALHREPGGCSWLCHLRPMGETPN